MCMPVLILQNEAKRERKKINSVSVIHWEELCRVPVTTRPHLENFFNEGDLPKVYTMMSIEAISLESSREYISKFFASNPCKGQGLKDYLDEQPLIDELVKTPQFCLLICHVWSEGLLDSGTTTQTELLDSVNVFFMRRANARPKSRENITPKQLKKIICQLGKVALTGLLDDAEKIVFTPHDFRKVPAILEKACELGLVSKTTVTSTRPPRSNEITSTTIEFYHKFAQEHSAVKFLANQTDHFLSRWKTSKLDRLLRKIKANIGDCENLIRFAAGTDNNICLRIMEVLLSNSFLDESERYRILLDCSSETKGTAENVSSFVQKCVTAQGIVLRSPTVYTVVGMQNLPMQLKHEVRTVKFEGSTLTTNVTSGLWSCLGSFTALNHLTISDSSLSFPPSPPKLLSVTKLSAERLASQSYERVLSSVPGVREIEVSIDDAETSSVHEITTASRPRSQTKTRDAQLFVHIRLHACSTLRTDREIDSGESLGGLSLLFGDPTRNQQRLHVSGVKGRDEKALINLFVKTKELTYLNSGNGDGSLSERDTAQNTWLGIQQCSLSAEMINKLWSCLKSFTSLNQLTISDSSLNFSPSPPELLSVTKLSAERLTSESYEGLLSSLSGVREIEVSVDDTETSSVHEITTASRPVSQTKTRDAQLFVHIRLHACSTLRTDREIDSGGLLGGLSLLFGDPTRNQQRLHVSGVKGRDEKTLINLFVKTKELTNLNSGVFRNGDGSLSDRDAAQNTRLEIQQCELSAEMIHTLWSCLKSFTSLNQLTIFDSSLNFSPSPPELLSVTKLSAERLTSESYEGVLSSVPGVREIEVSIDDAETSSVHEITTASRPRSQTKTRDAQLFVHIRLHTCSTLRTDRENDSGESLGGLSLLFRDPTRNQQRLHVSGVKGRDEKALIDLFVKTKELTYLNSGVFRNEDGSLSDRDAAQNTRLAIQGCKLSAEMTHTLWSCLKSFTSLNQLTISDSSLSFPPSPPELPSITKLSAESLTSESYEGVLSSVPGVREIEASIDVAETSNSFEITTASTPMSQTKARNEPLFVLLRLHACPSLTTDRKTESGEAIGGLNLLYEDQTKNQQQLHVSGMKGRDEKAIVDLFVKTKELTNLNTGVYRSGDGFLDDKEAVQNTRLGIQKCALSAEMINKLWSCLKSFTSLNQLTISDSSLNFSPSPPELPSVTKLSAERLTSESYEGLVSSLSGVREIEVSIDDAETSSVHEITTASRPVSQTKTRDAQLFVHIRLHACSTLRTDRKIDSEGLLGGLSLLFGDPTRNQQRLHVSGVKGRDEKALIDLFVKTKELTYLNSGVYRSENDSQNDRDAVQNTRLGIQQCDLSAEMTKKLWSCLKSFTSLNHLTISDSSLSFPPSPPELPSITKLSAKRVTSQSYEGLLSSLPGLRDIDITIDDAERDIPHITACLRRTGGKLLNYIRLAAPALLPSEKKSVSRETIRGLGRLIKEHTKNLQWLCLSRLKCSNEEDWVKLVESCTQVKTINHLLLLECGTNANRRPGRHNTGLFKTKESVRVIPLHDNGELLVKKCRLSFEMTARVWSCLRSFTSVNHLYISKSSVSFPPSLPELPSVTKLTAKRVTELSYEDLLSSLPGLRDIAITIDDAERDIPQITAGLSRIEGQQLTQITITEPLSKKKSVLSEARIIRRSRECGTNANSRLKLHITGLLNPKNALKGDGKLFVEKCQLSSEMTERLWSCLRSFTSLNHLTISDSSLSFTSSFPELPFVRNLLAERVTSQSYADLLISLPGLRDIDITIDDAEKDIPQITAGLRLTGGQQLTHIELKAPSTLPSEKTSVSRETMEGLGCLITDHTKNLDWLQLTGVKCTDEEDLVYLIKCCRHVKKISYVWLDSCGTREGGKLGSHLRGLKSGNLRVNVDHDGVLVETYPISHFDEDPV